MKDLKIKHWDAQISEDKVTIAIDSAHYLEVGEVDISLETLSKWEHLTADYGVSVPLFSSTSGDHAVAAKRKLFAVSRSAKRSSLALSKENDHEAWKSNLAQTLETLKLSSAPPETGLEKIAHSDSRCLVEMTQRISEFGSVLTPAELNKKVCDFLDNPAESSSVREGCAFMRCEQNWPEYNNGQGGADLVLSARSKSTNIDGDPKQVVIFHAAPARSFVAGNSGAIVSMGHRTTISFSVLFPTIALHGIMIAWFLLARGPKACN